MKTVFTYGGKNPYCPTADALIELRQSDDKTGRFELTYGFEKTMGLTYAGACKVLGQAILHHLSYESIVNNEGV